MEATDELIVPTVSLYEVFKRVLQQRGEGDALQAIALMQQGAVIELTSPIALDAARTSAGETLHPRLCIFGENVTPNLHKLARQFVLFDNFYVNGDVSAGVTSSARKTAGGSRSVRSPIALPASILTSSSSTAPNAPSARPAPSPVSTR